MSETLEPGWYWVKVGIGSDWMPGRYHPTYIADWWLDRVPCDFLPRTPAIIGPRLTPPGEG